MRHFWRRIALLLTALGTTLSIGAVGFRFTAGYEWFDALYMAAITMTTVGYFEVQSLSGAGRVFNIAYMMLSVTLLLLTIGMMTQWVVEMQLANVLERRRAKKMIDKMKNHYIVCGFGRVGRGAAAEVKSGGAQVVVVDHQEDRVEWALKSGYAALLGDSTRDDSLKEAGVERAAGMIAALSTDANNLFAVISAKSMNPKLLIAARVAEEEAEQKMRQVGADVVFAPYKMTGMRLAQSLIKPHVHQFLDLATTSLGVDVWFEQLAVSEGSDLAGKSIEGARKNRRKEADRVGRARADKWLNSFCFGVLLVMRK